MMKNKLKIKDPIHNMIRTLLIFFLAIVLKDGYINNPLFQWFILFAAIVIISIYIQNFFIARTMKEEDKDTSAIQFKQVDS